MRVPGSRNGIDVKGYAGTSGTLLAMDIKPALRDGLLGFAIQRSGGNRPRQFLRGTAHFPGVPHQDGQPTDTDKAPVQRFRWSDYRVYPDTEYTYTVYAAHGDWRKPELTEGPSVVLHTASVTAGMHRVLFNRAAAASQAFAREFPEFLRSVEHRPPGTDVVLPLEVKVWLSRGLLEMITAFIARAADPTWALDVAIYEYELPEIIDAVRAAHARGARVRIVYHADPTDEQTKANEKSLAGWPDALKRARVTKAICHDKFIVLSRLAGTGKAAPRAVLCGSTNFTENGVFHQANVCHVADSADIARRYAALFQQLFDGLDPAGTRDWIDTHNQLVPDAPIDVGFSPRSGRVDLDFIRQEIDRASRDVLFCTAFDLDDVILEGLLGRPHDEVLRLGLQNSRDEITGFHRDRTADFVTAAMFNTGLEGVLKESTGGRRGSIYIHTKLMVLDFTSDAPTIISGSHNFSNNASGRNDENYLIIRGDTEVADCYGIELMRLYDHYRARFISKPPKDGDSPRPKGPCGNLGPDELCPDDRWTRPYFNSGTLQAADRLRFVGRAV